MRLLLRAEMSLRGHGDLSDCCGEQPASRCPSSRLSLDCRRATWHRSRPAARTYDVVDRDGSRLCWGTLACRVREVAVGSGPGRSADRRAPRHWRASNDPHRNRFGGGGKSFRARKETSLCSRTRPSQQTIAMHLVTKRKRESLETVPVAGRDWPGLDAHDRLRWTHTSAARQLVLR